MSTKPGATTAPSASSTRSAVPDVAPTTAIRPLRIATSAQRAGGPVPSTTVPPRIKRSKCSAIVGSGPDLSAKRAGSATRAGRRCAISPLYVARGAPLPPARAGRGRGRLQLRPERGDRLGDVPERGHRPALGAAEHHGRHDRHVLPPAAPHLPYRDAPGTRPRARGKGCGARLDAHVAPRSRLVARDPGPPRRGAGHRVHRAARAARLPRPPPVRGRQPPLLAFHRVQ